jgi:hypothetical protein
MISLALTAAAIVGLGSGVPICIVSIPCLDPVRVFLDRSNGLARLPEQPRQQTTTR